LRGSSRPLLTVLTYHRVDRQSARPELDPALISAEPEEFERQVEWLARCATPISLAELLDVKRDGMPLPRRAVLVTFDDGYRDFARHAWPVLRRHGVPVTLFVPTSFPGEPRRCFWWDRLHCALRGTARRDPIETAVGPLPMATPEDRLRAHRALASRIVSMPHDEAMMTVELVCTALEEPEPICPLLDWGELRELAAEGVTLAPHTRTHPRLDLIPLTAAWGEIAGSREDLARQLGGDPPAAFAFPGGGHDGQLVRLLAEQGFELGFTTRRGTNDLSRPSWLSLRRINVGRRTTVPVLRAQLSSWARPAVRAVAAATGR
jgi:peptidoglycan/xylan/chitin deacetylase (PgdA/CDA1 family)